jgi:hypothetical protein
VIATAKHFILNNQEWARGNVSADVDERTLMELYMPPFAAAVEAGVGAVMCGYNRVNGVQACQSNWTIATQLRGHLGFKGFVMSGARQSTRMRPPSRPARPSPSTEPSRAHTHCPPAADLPRADPLPRPRQIGARLAPAARTTV